LSFSKLTLVVEFLVMAVVLVCGPGAAGQAAGARSGRPNRRCAARPRPGRCALVWLVLLALVLLVPLATATLRPADRHPDLRRCSRPACIS
jgi:branched-chain amino acid transport system permease protein